MLDNRQHGVDGGELAVENNNNNNNNNNTSQRNSDQCVLMRNFLGLYGFCFLLSVLLLQSPTYALSPDGEALLSFKRGLYEPNGELATWNASDANPCLWRGVTCLPQTNRVIKLNIPYRNLRGFISPDLGKLDQLRRLGLHRNNFFGPIPREISKCTNLKALYLRGNFLTGTIPEELGNLSHLTVLDVSSNGLTGSIPQSLGSLSHLTVLNVSANFLVGRIPTAGILKNFSSGSFAHNPGLCGPQVNVECESIPVSNIPPAIPPGVAIPKGLAPRFSPAPSPSSGWPLPLSGLPSGSQKTGRSSGYTNGLLISAMSTVGIALLVAVITLAGFFIYKKRCSNLHQVDQASNIDGSRLVMFHSDLPYTKDEVMKRIENLGDPDIIGSGGFGTVYKLVMGDGSMFAVKRIGKQGMGSERLFERELEILGSFKHRNLVNLRGYCTAPLANLLIYDYLPGGSLDENLHERSPTEPRLTWNARMKIAIGAARGLAYLHHDCCPRIIHRDIKSSNVLLDDDMEPHVSDFGLAKLLEDDSSHVTTIVAGTFGYLAPEYMQSGRATDKGDVYSYGVMLLELISGKRPTDPSLIKKGLNLVSWATSCIRSSRIEELVEPHCFVEVSQERVDSILQIALQCICPTPEERPTMDQVVQMLQADTLSSCPSDLSNFYNSPISDHEGRGR